MALRRSLEFEGVELGKFYRSDGAADVQIGKIYRSDGTADVLIYQAGDYDQLEYIETTGTQYIDTDIQAFNHVNVEIDFTAALTAINYNYNNMWNNTGGNEAPQGWVYSTGKVTYKWGDRTIGSGTAPDTSKHTYKFIKNGSSLATYIDDTKGETSTSSTKHPSNLRLFAAKNLSSYGKAKVYGVQIYVDNVLAYDLVPARRISDGVLGLRDTVNKKFYTNNGNGTFGAGAVVDTIE